MGTPEDVVAEEYFTPPISEEQRVREEALLTDEEICVAMIKSRHLEVTPEEMIRDGFLDNIHRAIAQAQLDKALNRDDVLIKVADQSLPKAPQDWGYTEHWEGWDLCAETMLKPDSEGNVWVKCLPKPARE